MLANCPPLGLFQVQTFGGTYSDVAFIFSLLMSVAPLGGRRVVRREKCALCLFVIDPFEFVITADRAGTGDRWLGIDRFEKPLQMRERSQRIGFAFPHTRRAVKPT